MIITDRLTIEKMAEDAFIYPQKYYFHYDYNDLCTMRKIGTFTHAYTKTIYSISEDFLKTTFKECSYHIPNKLKYGLVYYVVNTRFKIDEIDLFKLMNTTIKIINPMMPHNWFYPALITSDTIPLEEIKVNVLFLTAKCSMIEEDEFIEKQIGQYHKEQIRKIYPDSGRRFAYIIPEIQAKLEQEEKEKIYYEKDFICLYRECMSFCGRGEHLKKDAGCGETY